MKNDHISRLLHPIRLRIISRLMASGAQNTYDLQQALPDIPQASLYRHLQTLRKAQIIHVVEERPNRGTVEKVYTLSPDGESIRPEILRDMDKEQQFNLFTSFVAKLMEDYRIYLNQEQINPTKDGFAVRQIALWMNDEELETFHQQYKSLLQSTLHLTPEHGRKLRTLTTIIIPGHIYHEKVNPNEPSTDQSK